MGDRSELVSRGPEVVTWRMRRWRWSFTCSASRHMASKLLGGAEEVLLRTMFPCLPSLESGTSALGIGGGS